MGTNYYLYPKLPCPHCSREYPELHIGKSSGGWCFSLHVIPEERINDLPDWEKRLSAPDAIIKNEYGDVVTTKEMMKIITGRRWTRNAHSNNEWLEKNHAERGPNNLFRSRIDGRHCIGHGAGTWDLITGEFS